MKGMGLDVERRVREILGEALELPPELLQTLGRESALLGAVPELDSMGVLAVIHLLEERFDFTIGDDEIDGTTFATLGSLIDFVAEKLGD
ncbi:acyl carrier protein [Tepidiphilus olei]|jgi:acyl carrier protein|uniref:acyl carrier protein n=1 Tax=Tepidiphilus olei TaxID=2502184 RepID=UPI001C8F93EC|nr:phosphopantetheine-binding protein [Tepidiphilus olei]